MTSFLLHHLLAESAAARPDRPAVLWRDAVLTYRELDERSDRLACALQRAGVSPGDRVGIHLEKSPDAVIAIFGVLKAGATYVPIDPRAPVSRAAFIVGDCDMKGLIASQKKLEQLEPVLAARPRCILAVDGDGGEHDSSWRRILETPANAPADPGTIEQDLAYILYTSGSTGEPKGVMLSHRAALTFVNWALDYFRLQPEDTLSSHAPLHFDLSIFDLFGAVAAGAGVALVPSAATVFPRNLADWMASSNISVWYSVPSALIQLALNGGLERHAFESLRLILFAGEVFPVRHLRTLMEQLPEPAYFNLYGPTETNVCTVQPVAAPPAEDAPPLPIGRACANSEVFALTDEGRRVETGETGELYVRGSTLMQGYWGRPELTAAVLVPHPFHPERHERVYRTGDLVRLDESGLCHFIGRRDLQVKSRGYRIELGDIEAILHRHPAIAEAAVIALPHDQFGCTLKGIIAPRSGAPVKAAEIAAFCSEHLPPYMVPGDFEVRDSLPKTSNGKIDRQTLQATNP